MKKVKLKQGTLLWEKAKSSRIGGSEVFDLVRYYASDEELGNCGINAEDFKAEKPYTTAWAMYHKIRNDGIYKKEALAPEFAEYGHAAESYGVRVLQRGRRKKLKPGEVYADDRLIASLDISGVAEEVDEVPFDYGSGTPKAGQKFVCEQKTMQPQKRKSGIPFKYIIQAQYQIMKTNADFFILQIMCLAEDTPFIHGKICGMSLKKRFEYLDENMTVTPIYFKNNIALGELINVCIERFFKAVEEENEPMPFLECDSRKNIIESIRLNTLYSDDNVADYDLTAYIKAKSAEEEAKRGKDAEMVNIIESAKANNACKFVSVDGVCAKFSKSGAFLISEVR